MKRSIAFLSLVAVLTAPGCIAATEASRPEWPPSYKIAGGVLADAALSGAANAIQANTRDPEDTRDNYFLPIFGTTLVVDLALAATLYLIRTRHNE